MTLHADHLTPQERTWLRRIRDRKPIHGLPSAVSTRLRRLGLVQTVCGWSEISHEGHCLLEEADTHAAAAPPPPR